MPSAIWRDSDGRAAFDLGCGELAFPLIFDRAGAEYLVNVHLSPYAPREVAGLLDELTPKFRVSGGKVCAEAASLDVLLPLFEAHFVRLSAPGARYDERSQRAFLAQPAQQRLKIQAVRQGFFGAMIEYPDSGSSEFAPDELRGLPLPLDLGGEEETRITVAFSLWDEDAQKTEKLRVTHCLRPEVERDYQRYTRASRGEINSRRDQWQTITDHLEIARLYDSMILSLEGAVINGEVARSSRRANSAASAACADDEPQSLKNANSALPEIPGCRADNRDDWVGKVPLYHKALVMAELFREVRLKND